jgi:hypothetical protein
MHSSADMHPQLLVRPFCQAQLHTCRTVPGWCIRGVVHTLAFQPPAGISFMHTTTNAASACRARLCPAPCAPQRLKEQGWNVDRTERKMLMCGVAGLPGGGAAAGGAAGLQDLLAGGWCVCVWGGGVLQTYGSGGGAWGRRRDWWW